MPDYVGDYVNKLSWERGGEESLVIDQRSGSEEEVDAATDGLLLR